MDTDNKNLIPIIVSNSYIKKPGTDDTGYKTLYFLELPMKKNGLADKINAIMNDETYGKILRAKGFFNENDTWYQFNATSNEFEINEMPVGQQVFIIIGEEINESKSLNFLINLPFF